MVSSWFGERVSTRKDELPVLARSAQVEPYGALCRNTLFKTKFCCRIIDGLNKVVATVYASIKFSKVANLQ